MKSKKYKNKNYKRYLKIKKYKILKKTQIRRLVTFLYF